MSNQKPDPRSAVRDLNVLDQVSCAHKQGWIDEAVTPLLKGGVF